MEKLELKKKLEKKKAYLVCSNLFAILLTPTLLGLCRELNLSIRFQCMIFVGILMLIVFVYKKMNQVRSQIKTL